MTLTWHSQPFEGLTTAQLYAILSLRQHVFVVEQACAYLDADGIDPTCWHLWAEDAAGTIVAYLRIVPAGMKYAEPSIGRVIVSAAARGTGLGRELMRRGLAETGPVAVRIAAQAYLVKFYRDLGFIAVSGEYDDDGIMHVEMLRPHA